MTAELEVVADLAIGQVAEAAGVSVSAIRHYDEVGLVHPTGRVGGKRRFGADAVARVSFIRQAQAVGFSLTDIKALLDDEDGEWLALLDDHLVGLRRRRDELDAMIAVLEEARRCGCDVVARCPRVAGC